MCIKTIKMQRTVFEAEEKELTMDEYKKIVYTAMECGDEKTFNECTSLTEIVIPDSVKDIEWNAFSDCTALKSITFPDEIREVDEGAFNRCDNLTSIIWKENTYTSFAEFLTAFNTK